MSQGGFTRPCVALRQERKGGGRERKRKKLREKERWTDKDDYQRKFSSQMFGRLVAS